MGAVRGTSIVRAVLVVISMEWGAVAAAAIQGWATFNARKARAARLMRWVTECVAKAPMQAPVWWVNPARVQSNVSTAFAKMVAVRLGAATMAGARSITDAMVRLVRPVFAFMSQALAVVVHRCLAPAAPVDRWAVLAWSGCSLSACYVDGGG